MHCNVVFKNTKQIKTPAFHLPLFSLSRQSSLVPHFLRFFYWKNPRIISLLGRVFCYTRLIVDHTLWMQLPLIVRIPSVLSAGKEVVAPTMIKVVSVYSRVRHPLSNLDHSVIPVGSSPVPAHSGFPARLVFIPTPMLWPMCSIVCRTCVFVSV